MPKLFMLQGKISQYFQILVHTPFQNCPIFLFSRNPKDAAVSYFHMDKLMDNHGLRKDCEFEDYASKIFMTGKTAYGSYWNHVNVSQINLKSIY